MSSGKTKGKVPAAAKELIMDEPLQVAGKHSRRSEFDEEGDKRSKLYMSDSEVSSMEEVAVAPKAGIATAVAAGFGGLGKPKDVDGKKGVFDELRALFSKLLDVLMVDEVLSEFAKKVLMVTKGYDEVVAKLVAENERIKGRLDVYEKLGESWKKGESVLTPAVGTSAPKVSTMPPAVGKKTAVGEGAVVAPVAATVPVLPGPKPVETWSVVVKGSKGATSKEVMEKVAKEVGPSLGVRVHEMRPLKSGGAVIHTPSMAERGKVAANAKFGEVVLEVSVRDKLGPKVVVQRVHPEISPDEFMDELYSWNFKSFMSPEQFRMNVRLMTGPWRPNGSAVNVVLEGSDEAMQLLLDNGRCYIKWFSFLVRPQDAVPCCYRCLSFDHMVRECKMKDGVCRFCGETGHVASRCTNEIRCRNCAFKRLPADHLMMSACCPIYSSIVARQNARH